MPQKVTFGSFWGQGPFFTQPPSVQKPFLPEFLSAHSPLCFCIGLLVCLTKSWTPALWHAQDTKDLREQQRMEEMPLPRGCSRVRWGPGGWSWGRWRRERWGGSRWRWKWRGSYRLMGNCRWPRSKGLMRMTTRQPKKKKMLDLDLKGHHDLVNPSLLVSELPLIREANPTVFRCSAAHCWPGWVCNRKEKRNQNFQGPDFLFFCFLQVF